MTLQVVATLMIIVLTTLEVPVNTFMFMFIVHVLLLKQGLLGERTALCTIKQLIIIISDACTMHVSSKQSDPKIEQQISPIFGNVAKTGAKIFKLKLRVKAPTPNCF